MRKTILLAACLPACFAPPVESPMTTVIQETDVTVQQNAKNKVDILFMVDNSISMDPMQVQLRAHFGDFFKVFEDLAAAGTYADLHIGVVTSDYGAGDAPDANCDASPGGQRGFLQTMPSAKASNPPANCAPPKGAAYIAYAFSPAGGTPVTNLPSGTDAAALVDQFTCMASVGASGCGFEHQLESVLRALGADGAPAPPQNANFLRADAYLQVVLLTDEDDCSAPPDSDLFDSSSMTVSDPLGPLQSYRCNEFGHLCGGKRPPRQPMGEVDLGTCVSAEDGRLLRVADIVTALKRLKADPSKVMVAAITGPPKPYKVNVGPSQVKGDPSMWPYVEFSCIQNEPDNSQTFAAPSVRVTQLINAFGSNGLFANLCTPTFVAPLQKIAGQIAQVMGAPCFPDGADPSKCHFVDTVTDPNGNPQNTPLPRCTDASDPGPCWDVGASNGACAQPIVTRRPGGPVTTDAYTTVTCTP